MLQPTQIAHPSRFRRAPSTKGMQRVGAFAMLPALIRQLGTDPSVALADVGLAPNALRELFPARARC